MSNYVLDLAYRVEEPDGVERSRAVVLGATEGGCQYPAAANAGGVLGITIHAQSRQNKSVTVRRLGIAPCEAASAIAAGDRVCIADATGRVKKAAHATCTLGTAQDNNGITYTFIEPGPAGNLYEIHQQEAAGNNLPLSHVLQGGQIIISLATDGAGSATTTAAQLLAYIAATAQLSQLVTASHVSGSNGSGVAALDNQKFAGGEGGVRSLGTAQEPATAAGDIIAVLLTP